MARNRKSGRLLLATLALLAALTAERAVLAQLTEPGICPFGTALSHWDERQFVSEPWYEIKAFGVRGLHDALQPGCTRWHFSPSQDGQGLHARLAYRAREGDAVVRAFAQYSTSEKHPRFNLTFHDLGSPGSTRSLETKLVATDYEDFALLWGCWEPNLFDRKVVSWVLSRRPFLSQSAEAALRDLFRRHDIRDEKFVVTKQDEDVCGTSAVSGGPSGVTVLPGNNGVDSGTDSIFSSYTRAADEDRAGEPAASLSAGWLNTQNSQDGGGPSASAVAGGDPAVSWSYLGSGWAVEALGAQGLALVLLLALSLVSVVASLITFRVFAQRLRHPTKPVLPVHRQDIVVATLGANVDYSRFGGVGQGVVQPRKHAQVHGDAAFASRA